MMALEEVIDKKEDEEENEEDKEEEENKVMSLIELIDKWMKARNQQAKKKRFVEVE